MKNALVAQSEFDDSQFEINDVSIKQAIDSNWKKYARSKIKESDVVIFICRKYTNSATGVTAKMSITLEENANYFCYVVEATPTFKNQVMQRVKIRYTNGSGII